MKVTTKRQANGTYSYILDGVTTPTEAVTPYGARVQGLQMAAWVAGFATRTRKGYNASDVTLEG
ncbi:hypothetical protein [Streptomyces sp. NPDC048142]|uniref:hypothetical protein n=1 Tax=Streptomyces sp. NPDC048142 TaxID=3365501 RepID=UPI0037143419